MITLTQTLTNQDTLGGLTPPELELGKKILTTNLFFKPGESVLIVTDNRLLDAAAKIWFESAKALGAKVKLLVIDGMTHSGQEPPKAVVNAVKESTITLLHTYYSLTHTQAGKAVVANHHRGASLPGVDYEMMVRTLTQDYTSIQNLGKQIKTILSQAQEIQITSPLGTDLKAQIRAEKVINDGGFFADGEIGNLPAGEVFFAPLLGSAEGTWIVNGSMADDELDQSVTITISEGKATQISGGKTAENLDRKLSEIGELAFTVAEIGIGTNPKTNPHGDLIEAEKAYATAHLALGNSSAIGGEINVPIHLDGLTLEPKIEVDGTVICEGGEFVM